jgi:Protein of unknown function (DUF2815)
MTIADNELVIKNVRITTFGQDTIWEPKAFPGGKDPTKYYSLNGILPKNHPQIKEIEKKILAAAIDKWGATKGPAVLKAARMIGKVPLRDGDLKAEYDGFGGNMFISARSKDRPTVFDNMKNPVVRGDDNAPYDGCYADIKVSFYGYDKGNNGVGAGLKGVQFRGNGDRFSGGAPADADDFDEISAPEEGEQDELTT